MSEPSRVERPVRWRPHRAGIRNIWEYDDQVFDFADGRLILRGPNGSGKSNALALLVPFLLDGVMASHRMDSLSGGRSMKTLLLCLAEDERAKRFRYDQRTGYVWLELEKEGRYLTIGCGARASAQRDAEAWFFLTDRRCGIDLDLAPDGVPLSRGALTVLLGAGAVHDSAEAHRSAVDRALFGLGAHRFHNLVELLLVLRRPHLAGKLNVDLLSRLLSDGLVALDDQLIADVGASFEDLEAVQRDLRRLRDSHRIVQAFLPTYRTYLRAAARARANLAVDAHRSLRAAHRRVAQGARAVAAAAEELEGVRQARQAGEEAREVADQRRLAVLESPAYRDATSLVEVDGRAVDAERAQKAAAGRLDDAVAARQESAAVLSTAEEDLTRAVGQVDRSFTAAAETADQAGVVWPLARDGVEIPDLAPTLRGVVVRRRQDLRDVRAALQVADAAGSAATSASSTADRSAAAAESAEAARTAAAVAVDTAREGLAGEVATWIEDTGIAELTAVVGAVEAVGEPGVPSLSDVLAEVLQPRREELAARTARAEDLTTSLAAETDDLTAERRRVAEEPIPAPDRSPSRPAAREARRGAPLYACCDFADSVPAVDRAGLEAAIEASGLLDAWIGDGGDELDAWLRPTEPRSGPTLVEVLTPDPPPGSGLDASEIAAVLASVALEDAAVAVLPDGRYHLGPLQGRFAKPDAEFIGATAREERRRRLLADLDRRLEELATRLGLLRDELEAVVAEGGRLDDLARTLPSTAPLLAARDALVSAVAAARVTTETAQADAGRASAARQAADEKLTLLRALAGERNLPWDAEGLDGVDGLLRAHEERANGLVRATDQLADRRRARGQASTRAQRADQEVIGRRRDHDEQGRQAAGLRARADQLRAQLGPDAEAPLRQLKTVEAELEGLRAEADRLTARADAANRVKGAADGEQELAVGAVEGAEEAARAANAALDVLRRGDVWPVVAVEAPPGSPVELAAAVLAATTDVTEEADDNALDRAYRRLLDELRSGYDPGLNHVDRLPIVEVTSESGTNSIVWLADELGTQVQRQQELLSERDREIFEHHLLTRVSESLRTLLNDADDLVARINRSLADRPTASGKSVALRWELDTDDPGLRATIGLLRKTPELLGPDERDQLRRFFSVAISQRRAEQGDASYAEILRQVLDYRTWHAFVPQVRSAGGGTQRLTRTLFRSLSGGEQAVVLHLPLFAAAAAHYDGAEADAPRLIALDAAFAGIDEGMRAELMGLLVSFDLDVVLTGHELWGAYEEVPALMVYDLLRHPPLEGVSAFAVRWDGQAMAEV